MGTQFRFSQKLLYSAVTIGLLAGLASASVTTAKAGGFSIREQSVSGLGAAFAGNAAGYDLSTIYWNPAGVAIAGPGITTESHAHLIIPDVEVDPDDTTLTAVLGANPNSIDKVAFVPASYAAWRINDKLTIGYGFNAPFGLSSEADNKVWAGQTEFREAELLTYNFNPVVGYQISPTLAVGVGLQIMYSDLELTQADDAVFIANDLTFEGQDWSFGYTLGLLWRPNEGTSVGIGYRSQMDNTLEGGQFLTGVGLVQNIKAEFDLPAILTVSLRQAITPKMRLLGTFEWTDWDVLGTVVVRETDGTPIAGVEANWEDSYYLSGGLEYDYSDKLTVRGGIGYEWAPSQEPEQRLVSVPDNDRVWLSVGATYHYSETTTLDFAYTHIFVEDAPIQRGAPALFAGEAESSADILGVSFKTKWGADGPFGLLKGLNN